MIKNRSLPCLAVILISTLLLSTVCIAGQTFVMQWEKVWTSTIEPVFTEDGSVLLVSGKRTARIDSNGSLIWEWNAMGNVTSIADDKKSGAWAAHDGSISKIDAKGKQIWVYAHNDHIFSMTSLPDGGLTAGTDKGVLLLNEKGKKLWFFDPTAGCDI